MKNLILYLSICITIASCSFKQDSNVLLFNNISFELHEGEKVVKIDPKKKEIFDSYFNNKSIQIPLFKCIKSDNYIIFIGIPFNTSVKELTNYRLKNTLHETFFESDSITYYYKTYKNQEEQVTIYTRNFSDNLVYVLAISDSAKISDTLFNLETLPKRFNR